jgi:hypothetical protein
MNRAILFLWKLRQVLQTLTAGNKNVKRASKLGRCLISLSVQNCSRSPRRVTRHAFADYPHIHTQFPSCPSHGLFCVTDALGFLWLRGEWKRVEFVKDGISCVVSCQCHSDLWTLWMDVLSDIKSVFNVADRSCVVQSFTLYYLRLMHLTLVFTIIRTVNIH